MAEDNDQNQSPKPQQTETKPTQLPQPNQGETITKGG